MVSAIQTTAYFDFGTQGNIKTTKRALMRYLSVMLPGILKWALYCIAIDSAGVLSTQQYMICNPNSKLQKVNISCYSDMNLETSAEHSISTQHRSLTKNQTPPSHSHNCSSPRYPPHHLHPSPFSSPSLFPSQPTAPSSPPTTPSTASSTPLPPSSPLHP